jgi:hypothetical protein
MEKFTVLKNVILCILLIPFNEDVTVTICEELQMIETYFCCKGILKLS